MRLLKVELKRILKTRLTVILLSAALLLSFLLAWLPVTFSLNSYIDTEGKTVTLKGLPSIAYEKQLQADIAGTVTSEKVRAALEEYQACLSRYGVDTSYDLPDGVYESEILPYAPLLHGIREAFADPNTGVAPGMMEIVPEKVDDYYSVCGERIVSLMKQEQKDHPAARQAAVDSYNQVEKPYQFFPGYSTNAMDYEIFLAFYCAFLYRHRRASFHIRLSDRRGRYLPLHQIRKNKICLHQNSGCVFDLWNRILSLRRCVHPCIKQSLGLGMHRDFHADAVFHYQSAKLEHRTVTEFCRRFRAAQSFGRGQPYRVPFIEIQKHRSLPVHRASVLHYADHYLHGSAKRGQPLDLQHPARQRRQFADQHTVCRR